ncbi:hypothetical protein HPP92_002094 [Vanilla planifolia]|uniref:RING-type domain-containing protein n=1 Tax=Vanilla planifolia TaxID=51239 RepID=A0A835SE27_VANPL|nr:hypothetical protein HPP92_027593 [Vanilla planifolia]KAG0502022.1 hypothetical protein HPP92_002094 [Vanilla planifolia]
MEDERHMARGSHGEFRVLGHSGVSPNFLWLIAGMLSGAVTGLFALVGAFVGALSGALAGRASDTGILRGAVLGAIAGAVLAIEILEAYDCYLRSDQSNSRNTAMHRILALNHNDELGIVGEFAPKGLTRDLFKKLPVHVMPDDVREGHEECICCTICLQDILGGETVRILPLCFHTFHLSCVDKWLVTHSSCPVCRQGV